MQSFSNENINNNEYSYQLTPVNRKYAGTELKGIKNNSLNEVGHAS